MKSTLRCKKGITLIVLVITVVLMLILAGTAVTVSIGNLTESKRHAFVSELQMVERKMLVINKEISLGSNAYDNIGTKYENLSTEQQERVEMILSQNGVTDYSNYRYMSIEDLSKIGLKNMEQDVIISYGNSEVYSYEGLKYDNDFYYSVSEIEKLD